ncbi:unnamed protein product, partial [Closterium sp. NIES-64]
DLPSNAINGTIPVRTFQQLKQLQILDLSRNNLVPPFPARALQYMTGLRVLDLHLMELDSPLDMLGYSTAFQYIDLSYTESTGALPPSLAAASNLSHLDLMYNYPTGSIVSILSNLTSLTFLSIIKAVDLIDSFASFSSLSRLSLLQHLELVSLHNMTGSLEDMTFLTSLPKLRHLHFGDMNVEGELPPELILLDKLTYLDLSYLYFNDVPLWLGTFTNLRTLAISDTRNMRSGAVPQDLSRLSHLVELDLSINQMSGSLPTSFSPALQYLSVPSPACQCPLLLSVPFNVTFSARHCFLPVLPLNLLPCPPLSLLLILLSPSCVLSRVSPFLLLYSLSRLRFPAPILLPPPIFFLSPPPYHSSLFPPSSPLLALSSRLNDNQFQGSLPSALGNLPSLATL